MELRGYNRVLPVWYYTLCNAIVLWSTILEMSFATIPSLTLSNTNLMVRNGEMLELKCEVDRSYGGTGFSWEHYRNSTEQTDYYTSSSTVQFPENVNITFDTTRTVLQFENVSLMDSGVIRCAYKYPGGQGSKTASLETSLCVSVEPGAPTCFNQDTSKDNFSLLCTTADMALCPLDISLQIRSARNGTIVDGHRKYFPIERITNDRPKEQFAVDGYICTLSSKLFPSSNASCSFVLPETTTLTISSKFVSDANYNTDITAEINKSTTVGTITNKNEPITFTKIEVIIAACAAGGGVLFIAIFICIIIACCKRCNRLNEMSVEKVDMAKRSSETQSQTSDERHQNSDILLLERTPQNGQERKGSMPPYATPDKSGVKNKPPAYDTVHENNPSYYSINDETSNSSALYATADEVDDQRQGLYTSVPQKLNEEAGPDGDREKVLTPNFSPSEYAYASFDLTKGVPTPEDATNRQGGEGFVDNSIYEPSLG